MVRPMDRLLELLLRRFVRRGTLRFTTARGSVFTVGDGTGPPVAIRFMTKAAERGVLLDPELKLGEAYMDGTLADRARHHRRPARDRARSDQRRHAAELGAAAMVAALSLPAAAAVQPSPTRARRNVAHHYDLDGRLYSLFLDADRQYSCAYFEQPEQSLDDAQLAKKRHLAAKLLLDDEPARVLDIGCGWGGLALYLAEFCGAHVTGVTLSQEQHGSCARRARGRRKA